MIHSPPLFALVLATLASSSAQAETVRSGFAFDISLGLGLNSDEAETRFATAQSIGVGAFLSNDLSLNLRYSVSTSFVKAVFVDSDGRAIDTLVGVGTQFLGPSVTFWMNDAVYLGLGAGLGVYGPSPLFVWFTDSLDLESNIDDPRYGVGASLRGGGRIWQRENAAVIFVGAEAIPLYIEDEFVIGAAVVAGLQIL